MHHTISTIQEYISSRTDEDQKPLIHLYSLIQKHVPKEAIETISCKMPTFRYNGNLIHFALFKKHIGIYPGADAIEHFKNKLKDYKTSKGAIQIPLTVTMPDQLIIDLLKFNIEILEQKKGPNWHTYRENWEDANIKMQTLVQNLNLTKEFKWGSDVYTHKTKNVVAWSGFKNFFSIWFYNGVFLKDPLNVLVSGTEGKTKAMRQWRFKPNENLDLTNIEKYIIESIQTIDQGKEIIIEKNKPLIINDALLVILESDENLKKAFLNLTKGKQREYNEYIEQAKQEKTKASRIEKIKPLILENKGLNDKYKK